MKLTILYHSKTGNTKGIAEIIAEGARDAGEVEVRCMSIDNVDYDYINNSDAVIFGCPTYYANLSWQIKKWFDEDSKACKLGGKLGAAFATENTIGGGADFALLTLAGHMLVKGMLIYSGGTAEGHPITHYGIVCIKNGDEEQKKRARIFGKRIAMKAIELFTKG
ncbi:MAG: flavodoxin family protein [Vulcanibacillus sp.]